MIPQSIVDGLHEALKAKGFSGQIVYENSVDPMTMQPCIGMSYVEDGQDPKKLVARWSLEAQQDLSAFGIDIEKELVKALASEIVYELELGRDK